MDFPYFHNPDLISALLELRLISLSEDSAKQNQTLTESRGVYVFDHLLHPL